jgi:hypothetical protein
VKVAMGGIEMMVWMGMACSVGMHVFMFVKCDFEFAAEHVGYPA